MNLDSIHRLIEETQIFQMQQSSIKPRCDKEAPSPCPRDTCGSCLPPCGLSSPAACDFSAHPFNTNKWDICEELRRRELEEVKARAAQMEKTMRWWSDCTANWREKWSKVRAERNSAREEGRQLRIKLEMAMKELSALKKKQSLSLQKEVTEATVTQDLELPGFEGSHHRKEELQTSSAMCGSIGLEKRQLVEEEDTKNKEEGVVLDSLRLNEEMKPNPDCTDLFRKGGFGSCAMKPGLRLPAGNLSPENAVTKVSAWQLPLEDFQEILWKEREMRVALEKEVERLESALSLWKWKYEELKASKQANVQELERKQAENTLEWDKRELLETEKQGLERENRRLKVQVKEMEELLDRKSRLSENFQGPDFKTSYSELQEKNKELLELRHAYQKLRRQYQVKVAELNPANSPVDQNEAEAKKLRFQVEELKLGLN
ncbi:coiled-coil domain-containing protein 102B isoform X2 [Marmota flaviventris]|uniref:coiled-coil domain-containing protein 102B isoform X2 n=1 Tax=Marmota flaviventris TaxID=93162 RepID=UPI003A8927B8